MDLTEVTIAGVGAMPLVVALVELAKRNFKLPSEYAPFIAVALGVLIVALAQGFSVASLMAGVVVGLSASGLWSAGKKFGKAFRK